MHVQTPDFISLLAEIDACIAALGGKVVPRLNWSCPTDAAWISATQSIACTSADEVRPLVDISHGLLGCASQAMCNCLLQPGLRCCIAAGVAAAEELGPSHARRVRRLCQLPCASASMAAAAGPAALVPAAA